DRGNRRKPAGLPARSHRGEFRTGCWWQIGARRYRRDAWQNSVAAWQPRIPRRWRELALQRPSSSLGRAAVDFALLPDAGAKRLRGATARARGCWIARRSAPPAVRSADWSRHLALAAKPEPTRAKAPAVAACFDSARGAAHFGEFHRRLRREQQPRLMRR